MMPSAVLHSARDLDRGRILHVEADRPAIARQRILGRHRAAGPIDPDHFRAMIGEHHATEGARPDSCKFDDAHACQWSGHE